MQVGSQAIQRLSLHLSFRNFLSPALAPQQNQLSKVRFVWDPTPICFHSNLSWEATVSRKPIRPPLWSWRTPHITELRNTCPWRPSLLWVAQVTNKSLVLPESCEIPRYRGILITLGSQDEFAAKLTATFKRCPSSWPVRHTHQVWIVYTDCCVRRIERECQAKRCRRLVWLMRLGSLFLQAAGGGGV